MQAIWLGLAALLVISSCKGNIKSKEGDTVIILKSKEGEPLAQVGAVKLTVEEMRTDFQERQGQFKGAPNYNNDKARTEYIENQVLQEALFQEAIVLNYFDRLDVKRDIKKTVVQKLMKDKLDEAQNTFEPTEEQIKEHYEKNTTLYNREESIKAAFIMIPFGENKQKAKDVATGLHKEAVNTIKHGNARAFIRLAAEYAPKNKNSKGLTFETNETDFMEKSAFDEKFGPNTFEAMKSMEETGQIAPMVSSDKAFFVVMKTGHRKKVNETLEEAKAKITKRLSFENRGDIYKKYLENIKKKYDVKIFQERVADLSKGMPPPPNVAKNAPVPTPPGANPNPQGNAPGHEQ